MMERQETDGDKNPHCYYQLQKVSFPETEVGLWLPQRCLTPTEGHRTQKTVKMSPPAVHAVGGLARRSDPAQRQVYKALNRMCLILMK